MTGEGWDPAAYAAKAGFVPELGRPVLEWLNPRPHERILDLGCGDGQLTREIAASGARVVGVDADPAMVDAARARGVDARLGDARALWFDADFDAVVSNAALHWIPEADEPIAGVRRALKPRGRFVGEMGGHGNVAAVQVALTAVLERHGLTAGDALPWYFPDAPAYRARLTNGGLTVDHIELIPRPTPLPGGIEDWLEVFAAGVLAHVPAESRAAARAAVADLLRPVLQDSTGTWIADYVRLRFAAHRPAG